MTQDRSQVHLSRRERQIMEIVYRQGRASVGDVLSGLPDPPSYSAVRALLIPDADRAFEWLDRARQAGFDDDGILATDPDLDALRKDPRFRKLARESEQAKREKRQRY